MSKFPALNISGHLNVVKYILTPQCGQVLLDISTWKNIAGHLNVDKYFWTYQRGQICTMHVFIPPPPKKKKYVVPQVVPPNDQKQFRRLRMLSGWMNVRGQDLTEILCRRFLRQFGNS